MNNGPDRFCSQCGISISMGSKFCGQCGSPLLNGGGSEKLQSNSFENDVGNSISVKTHDSLVHPKLNNRKSMMAYPAIFFIMYVVSAIPTYILPYFGSNSALVNSIGAAIGYGFTPQFWLHLISLYILVIIAWFRGALIGRSWLASLPAIAGIFDLMPGMNWLPLAPTLFHVATLRRADERGQRRLSYKTVTGSSSWSAK